MDRPRILAVLLAGMVLALGMITHAWGAPASYALTDLGAGTAIAIADDGTVVGSLPAAGLQTAAILTPPVTWLLPRGAFSQACGIAHGVIIGYQSVPASFQPSGAWLWAANLGVKDMRDVRPDVYFSVPHAINSIGEIAGQADYRSERRQVPVVWTPAGGLTILPTLGYTGRGLHGTARAINTAGEVAGMARTATGSLHATLWRKGTPLDLHTAEGESSMANGLNNVEQVVGHVILADSTARGFVWLPLSGMLLLPPLPEDTYAYAYAINDAGVVVGSSVNATAVTRAVRWVNGVVEDLNTVVGTGTALATAVAINQQGQIAVNGPQNEAPHAWLLTPIPDLR
jgi:probable HAF family extracellular repeat protein